MRFILLILSFLLNNESLAEEAHVRLLKSADLSLTARVDSIEKAKTEILIETFYLENDETGLGIIAKLIEAKKQKPGLNIKLLLDAWGSASLPIERLCQMKESGINVKIFNKSFGPVQNRTHRKIWITDNNAIIGGRNLSDENLKDELINPETFYDWDVELKGDIVLNIRASFDQAWNHSKSKNPNCSEINKNINKVSGDDYNLKIYKKNDMPIWHRADIEWLADPVAQPESRPVLNKVVEIINTTNRSLDIENAYFLPVDPLSKALGEAEKRKLKISFNINGPKFQSWMSKYSSCLPLNNIQWWLTKGAKVNFTPADKRTHAKTLLSDMHTLAIGSFNFDSRSINMNAETLLVIKNSDSLINEFYLELQNRNAKSHNVTDISQIFRHYEISSENEKECRDISYQSPLLKYWF